MGCKNDIGMFVEAHMLLSALGGYKDFPIGPCCEPCLILMGLFYSMGLHLVFGM